MVNNKQLYEVMVINPDKIPVIDSIIAKIKPNEPRYKAVGGKIGVPWQYIAVIHYRESSLNFKRHLHNGDPLTARTTHVPKGRPIKGNPPFTWEESAEDALRSQGWNAGIDWDISNPDVLDILERYNGLGYRKKGLPSPYLWSFSSNYKKGKYVADGKFDPEFVDGQCGVAVLLKLLL